VLAADFMVDENYRCRCKRWRVKRLKLALFSFSKCYEIILLEGQREVWDLGTFLLNKKIGEFRVHVCGENKNAVRKGNNQHALLLDLHASCPVSDAQCHKAKRTCSNRCRVGPSGFMLTPWFGYKPQRETYSREKQLS